MKIIVCIKQVPDTVEIKFNEDTGTLIREGVDSVINPFDYYAIEEGLSLRERYGGTVTVLSMGPPQVIAALREAVSLGADKAALLADPALAGADTLATSYALAKGVEKTGHFDLVICGRQAIDGDTAQVGPELAERLGVPHVSCVIRVHEVADGCIIAERMTEDGSATIKFSLPGLITVSKGINEPRFPSLKGKIRGVRSEIPIWSVQDIGADASRIGLRGSPVRVIRIFAPERRARGQMLEGTVREQVTALVAKLREANIV